jgi:hypothetical protein
VHGIGIAIGNQRIVLDRFIYDIPIDAKLLPEIVHEVEKDDLRVATSIMRVLEDLRLGAFYDVGILRFRKRAHNFFCCHVVFGVAYRHADEVYKRMRGIVHVRSYREEFWAIENDLARKLFLQLGGRPRKDRRFDDGNFPVSYERQNTFDY